MIAITFALPQESSDLLRRLTDRRKSSTGRLTVYEGKIDAQAVAICHTGIGRDSAARAMHELFHSHRPQTLISAGFAGGLDPRLQCADLVVAVNFSDSDLLDAARHACRDASRCYFGTLTTQPEVAETEADKLQLGRQTGASAVDMETSVIAESCHNFSVPMLSVRGVSDRVSDALPVPFPVWFDLKNQRPRPVALLQYLVLHPRKIMPFVRFVRGIDVARARLTDYLLELIPAL